MFHFIRKHRRPAALLAVVFCLNLVTLREVHNWAKNWRPAAPLDWAVYQSAALVVSEGQSYHLYDGADTGVDPQLRGAPLESPLTKASRRLGLRQETSLYVYPPLLADLLVPLLAVPVQQAAYVWDSINIVLAVLCISLAIALTQGRYRPLVYIFAFACLFEMRGVIEAIYWGQVTILVTFLWMLGVFCYKKGGIYASALALALATWLKLTPLLAIIPFVLWKEWRWLRWYAANTIGLLLILCVINGPHSLWVCFTRVMPAMSRGIVNPWNRTWISYVQTLYVVSRHVVTGWTDIIQHPVTAPEPVVLLGKVVSAAVLVWFVMVLYRRRNEMDVQARVEVLVATALLSVVIAPVSWTHAFIVLEPALILAWARAFREPARVGGLALLSLASLILPGAFLDHVVGHAVHSLEAQTLLAGLHPALCSALCFYMVLQTRAAIGADPEASAAIEPVLSTT